MRNTGLEEKIISKLSLIAGLGIVVGVISLAVGTEIWILSLWPNDTIMCLVWQGVWAIGFSVIISVLTHFMQLGLTKR